MSYDLRAGSFHGQGYQGYPPTPATPYVQSGHQAYPSFPGYPQPAAVAPYQFNSPAPSAPSSPQLINRDASKSRWNAKMPKALFCAYVTRIPITVAAVFGCMVAGTLSTVGVGMFAMVPVFPVASVGVVLTVSSIFALVYFVKTIALVISDIKKVHALKREPGAKALCDEIRVLTLAQLFQVSKGIKNAGFISEEMSFKIKDLRLKEQSINHRVELAAKSRVVISGHENDRKFFEYDLAVLKLDLNNDLPF